jgi:hypothetical protein
MKKRVYETCLLGLTLKDLFQHFYGCSVVYAPYSSSLAVPGDSVELSQIQLSG